MPPLNAASIAAPLAHERRCSSLMPRRGLWPYSTSISVRPPGRARPRAQWRRLDGRLVPEAPEASPVLPQRRHKGAAVPRGACTRRSTTRGRALLAPLESVAP